MDQFLPLLWFLAFQIGETPMAQPAVHCDLGTSPPQGSRTHPGLDSFALTDLLKEVIIIKQASGLFVVTG